MSTLLLRLAAPLQSWGTEVRYDVCTTQREPTRSGVMGMIAAAFGSPRDKFPSELNSLKFGVRVDREGELLRDYHTARSVDDTSYVTNRYYLSDAVFLAGLEGDRELLERISYALTHPFYPLYLGRRSCPPEGRIVVGIRENDLVHVLENEPLLCDAGKNTKMRMLFDAEDGAKSAGVQRDLIISLDFNHRRYGFRGVREKIIQLAETHDPMSELEV